MSKDQVKEVAKDAAKLASDVAKGASAAEIAKDAAELIEDSIPTGGKLWAILRGGTEEMKLIADGKYDKVAHELYNMAVRHAPSMVGALASRLAEMGVEIPHDDSPVADPRAASPKPFKPPGGRRR